MIPGMTKEFVELTRWVSTASDADIRACLRNAIEDLNEYAKQCTGNKDATLSSSDREYSDADLARIREAARRWLESNP
jgi:hypothetical protein